MCRGSCYHTASTSVAGSLLKDALDVNLSLHDVTTLFRPLLKVHVHVTKETD